MFFSRFFRSIQTDEKRSTHTIAAAIFNICWLPFCRSIVYEFCSIIFAKLMTISEMAVRNGTKISQRHTYTPTICGNKINKLCNNWESSNHFTFKWFCSTNDELKWNSENQRTNLVQALGPRPTTYDFTKCKSCCVSI